MGARRKRASGDSAVHDCCRTCRSRRVRCDGKRPACVNCTGRGCVCPGYPNWEISLDISSVESTPTLSPNYDPPERCPSESWDLIPSVPSLAASANIEVNDPARHAFDYFRLEAYGSYIERGYPTLWADCAISAALSEPAVFYAVAALGTAARALTQSVHTSLDRPIDDSEKNLALEMYSKSLASLRRPMQKAMNGAGPLRPVILSCLVFLVFETTVGTHLNAMRHVRTGNNILNERLDQYQGSSDTSSASGHSTPHSTNGEPIRVESPTKGGQTYCLPPNCTLGPGMLFASIEDARACLEALTDAGQDIRADLHWLAKTPRRLCSDFASKASGFCLKHTTSRVIAVDTAFQQRMNNVLNGFVIWGRQFRGILTPAQLISPDLLFMQIRHFQASFTLAMSRGIDERLTDCFGDEIARTLDNIERLVRPSSLMNRTHTAETSAGPIADDFIDRLHAADRGTQFRRRSLVLATSPMMGPSPPPEQTEKHVAGIFEFGILPALYAIACKCRTSPYRRRAARLLREVERVEAVNSSRTLSMYAEAVIELEEQSAAQSMGQLDRPFELYADEVPKQARFLDVVASKVPTTNGQFTLSCTRLANISGNDLELWEYVCNGEDGHYSVCHTEVISANAFL